MLFKESCKIETYRVTHQAVTNLLLTSKHKFRFSLARSGQARHKTELMF